MTILSLLLGMLSCGVTFALYKRRKWAPRLMIVVQVPFAVYDMATRQYGFIMISLATIVTAIIAHQERHEIDPRLAMAVHEKAHRIRAEDDLEHHEAAWVAAESLGVSRPEFSRIRLEVAEPGGVGTIEDHVVQASGHDPMLPSGRHHAVRSERHGPQPDAARVEDRVRDGGRHRDDRGFTAAR